MASELDSSTRESATVLASVDPDYLHWLARHPSGARYRSEISRALGIGLRSAEY